MRNPGKIMYRFEEEVSVLWIDMCQNVGDAPLADVLEGLPHRFPAHLSHCDFHSTAHVTEKEIL